MSKVTEAELRAGAVAPRVTMRDLENNIVAVNYLNVGKAIARTTNNDHASHHLLTICVIVLSNGFTVTGESACASPENYNEKVGQMIAYENAKEKIWPLMGYSLRNHLQAVSGTCWEPEQNQ